MGDTDNFEQILKALANERYAPLLEWEADNAPVTVTSKTLVDLDQIPYDVWLSIFENLTLTDLVLTGRVCNSFQKLARQRILARRLERSLFQHKTELALEGFRFGPILSPITGDLVVVFKPDGIPQLQAWEISSAQLKSTCQLPPRIRDHSPLELRVSNTGAYFCVHYELFVLVYALHLDVPRSMDLGIRLVHIFQFHIPIGVQPDPQQSPMELRILSAFSKDDTTISVCRIDRSGSERRSVTLQYTAVKTNLCGYPPCYPYAQPTVSTYMTRKTFHSHLPWANIRQIDINASPLRIIVPPDLYIPSGFLLRGECPDDIGFVPIQTRDNRVQKLQFSRCGQFLIEANSDEYDGFFEITLKWWDLTSGNLCHRYSSVEKQKMLSTLLSKDSKTAIAILGHNTVYDSICVTGWNIYRLESGEAIRVGRKCHDLLQRYEPHFSISDDAELVAMVVEKNPPDTDYVVEVYEAGTGIQMKSALCKIHYNAADHYFDTWMSLPGAHGCTHLVGDANRVALTTFATCSRGMGFTHFKTDNLK